jgi:hypothetical protein
MESLRPSLSRYLDITRKIATANEQVSLLRDERRTIELDLSAVYNEAQLPDTIDLNQSHMRFTVKRPGQWKKGWTLSKKQLEEYLRDILPEHGEDVLREIVIRHDRKMTATDYAFDLKPFDEDETAT